MPLSRKHRVWYPGAVYHISSRGNRKSAIFIDDLDRLTYLELLEEARFYYPFILHSYCLMTNHTHLQLETIFHHPKEIMKLINSRYAMYFNKRHDLVGHVFQGRYGAELIDSAKYFLDVNRYIHLNPFEAGMVNSIEEYPWCSYAAYISNAENPHITTERVLSFFPEPQKENYRKFMEASKLALITDKNNGKMVIPNL